MLRSGDAQLLYEVVGSGPDLVLLHPFPLNHHFWTPVTELLSTRYRVLLPDLRAHGDSEAGEGPVTMSKLADDLARLCREERIAKATFVGVSIGGYLLFEFWRRYRDHVGALLLANTRPGAETTESKAARLQVADKVLHEGTGGFIEDMLSKLLSQSTRTNRPDLVQAARRMMQKMSPDGHRSGTARHGRAPGLGCDAGHHQRPDAHHRRGRGQHPAERVRTHAAADSQAASYV